MPTIEIADLDARGALVPELRDLLDRIEPWGRGLRWAVLELEAAGEVPGRPDILALEREIAESPTGLPLGWDEMKEWSTSLSHVSEAAFAGFRADRIPAFESWEELPERCDIVIELIDSSVWRVSAKDSAVLDELARGYQKVTRI